nr:unnamed protein product [Callosobruchus analis]CAI5835149.1 unnamed protein product [Callosobruchus analis]
MKAESSVKDDFHLLTLEQLWIKRLPINSTLASLALRVLIPCFYALVLTKTKRRSRLDICSDLLIALTKAEPRINQLVLNMQSQESH